MSATREWLIELLRQPSIALLADIAVKATVLVLLAMFVLRLLPRLSAAVRHWVWCLTFCGLIVLPALCYVLPAWAVPILPSWYDDPPPILASSVPDSSAPVPAIAESAVHPSASDRSDLVPDEVDVQAASATVMNQELLTDKTTAPMAEVVPTSIASKVPAAEPPPGSPPFNPLAGWLVGAALCLLPLVAGLLRSAILRAKARRVQDAAWLSLRDHTCARLGLRRAVQLLEIRAPIIPMSCGVVRPAVILPADAGRWNEPLRRFVLLHELAHVKRHDVVFQLLARLACVLYWFHPLVWYAMHRLRIERELACDDAVLAAGERASDYAEQLLEVARRLQPLRLHAAVAMAQSKKLEYRVGTLFSHARSHLPLSPRASRLLLACAVGVVIAVSVVRPSARATIDETPTDERQAVNAEDSAPKSENETPRKIRGRVVANNAKPIGGARVVVVRVQNELHARAHKTELLTELVTGSDGRFEAPFPAEPPQSGFYLLATAPGHGLAWDYAQSARAGKECVLKLAADDVPLEGRILDLEGQPITGVQVAVRSITASADNIEEWIKKARDNPAEPPSIDDRYSYYYRPPKNPIATFPIQETLELNHPQLTIGTTTDANGRFRLMGLGGKRFVRLEVSGAGIAKGWINAVTYPMEPVPYPQVDPRYRFTKCFGARFDISVEPEQRITGVVRDAATRQPLADVEVRLRSFANYGMGYEPFVSDLTDADGRYELTGVPRPGDARSGLRLRVIPPGGQPYFRSDVDAPRAAGLDTIVRDVELNRSIWVRGRVVDERTGKPVQGEVAYYPFLTNEAAKDYANFDPGLFGIGDDYHYTTAEDGSFRVPGLPGRGVLAFIANEDVRYPRADGADAIGGLRRRSTAEPQVLYYFMTAEVVNAVREINPPAGAEEFAYEIRLNSYKPHKLRLLDPNGEPLAGVTADGLTGIPLRGFRGKNVAQSLAIVEVLGLAEDERRPVMLVHADRGLATAIAGVTADDFPNEMPKDVTLLPAASIVGRLLDENGKPVSEASAFASLNTGDKDESKSMGGGWSPSRGDRSNADGRFRIDLVPSGVKYSFQAYKSATDRGATLEIGPLKPGAQLNLGDITLLPPKPEADAPSPQPRPISFEDRFPTKTMSSKALSKSTENKETKKPPANIEKDNEAGGHEASATETQTSTPSANGPAPAATAGGDARVLRSRVVGPDGKPVAGAKVMVWRDASKNHATTHEDGTFEIPLTESASARDELIVTAEAKGFGMGWNGATRGSATPPIELRRLVAIDGRIVDLEGQPIEGVTVSVDTVVIPNDGVDAWLDAVEKGTDPARAVPSLGKWIADSPHNYPEAKTDAGGRFRIDSIGADQQLKLSFRGPSVAFEYVYVVTKPLAPIVWKFTNSQRIERVYGLQFTHVASPSRPIRGVVRDATTAEAMAGVEVRDRRWAGSTLRGAGAVRSMTNPQGRFEIHSIPVGEGQALLLVPNDQQPYFIRAVDVPSDQRLDPIEMNVEVHRGLWIVGRVLDKSTRKPVAGARVYYLPFFHNKHAQALPEFDQDGNAHGASIQGRYLTDANGEFRLPGLPGPAVVGVDGSDEVKFYRRGVGFDEIAKQYGKEEETGWLNTWRNPVSPSAKWPLSMTTIDPQEGADEVRVDFELDPGLTVSAEIVDPNSEPVAGVAVGGRSSASMRDTVGPQFEIINLGPDEARTVLLQNEARQLGKVVRVTPAEHSQKRLRIQLEPLATITGRLVDNDGNPVATAQVRADLLPGGDFSLGLPAEPTDSDGRFRVENVPVGCVYRLFISAGTASRRWSISKAVLVEAGQTTDVGSLSPKTGYDNSPVGPRMPTVERRESTTPARQEKDLVATVDNPATRKGEQTTVRGQIVGPDGRPAAAAHVAVIARREVIDRGAELEPDRVVLAEATADDDGEYQLTITGASSKSHPNAYVVARSKNSALTWHKLNLDAAEVETPFELKPGKVLNGRLVDIEGQPAAAVELRISAIRPAVVENQLLPGGIDFWRSAAVPAAWPQPVFSDSQGRFSVAGIPANHGVFLNVEGSERFAPQTLALNTGLSEQRDKSDATYRPQVKNAKPSGEVVLPLAPAQIFTGRVTYEDTGEGVPNAPVQIWASQQQVGGSMIGLGGRADGEGRYRLNPYPGVRFAVAAYAPEGAPYLTRRVDDIAWDSGSRTKDVNIILPRAPLVRGQVLEVGTDRPVAGASVQYHPERANNPNVRDDFPTGWQAIETTDQQGRFQIVVLPGLGRLLVHGSEGKYVLQETSSDELYFGRPGGRRYYMHGIARIEPAKDSNSLDATIRLTPGETAGGELVDEEGRSVDEALMITRLHVRPYWLQWRGSPQEVLGGRFELGGLAPGQEYPVHFLEPKQRLGATVMLKAGDEAMRVVLKPCGEATMRFVDPAGKPIPDHQPQLWQVVTPGPHDLNRSPEESKTLAADSDFVSNIDRLNHGNRPKADGEGRVTLPALIPGATYRVLTTQNDKLVVAKEFQVKSGETIDLGDIVYKRVDR